MQFSVVEGRPLCQISATTDTNRAVFRATALLQPGGVISGPHPSLSHFQGQQFRARRESRSLTVFLRLGGGSDHVILLSIVLCLSCIVALGHLDSVCQELWLVDVGLGTHRQRGDQRRGRGHRHLGQASLKGVG